MAKKSIDVTVNPIVDEKLVAKTDQQTATTGKGSAKPTPDKKVVLDSSVLKSRH